MYAEIIAIGTELLLGATVDTNSAYLEQQLATVGIAVQRVTLVRDDLPEMIEVIHAATQRDERGVNDIIVVREVIVAGLPESVAGERIFEMMNLPNPVVGITVKRGQHTIRIAATATSREDAEALIAPLVATIEERFVGYIV